MPSASSGGLFLAVVLDNRDPEGLLRLKVSVPSLEDMALPWAQACIPVGALALPEVGAAVWVLFEGGDPGRPVWIGTLPQAAG